MIVSNFSHMHVTSFEAISLTKPGNQGTRAKYAIMQQLTYVTGSYPLLLTKLNEVRHEAYTDGLVAEHRIP